MTPRFNRLVKDAKSYLKDSNEKEDGHEIQYDEGYLAGLKDAKKALLKDLKTAGVCPECEKLKKSLEFYADAERWKEVETGIGMLPGDAIDYGATAREALANWVG